jgi:hypothetical protein
MQCDEDWNWNDSVKATTTTTTASSPWCQQRECTRRWIWFWRVCVCCCTSLHSRARRGFKCVSWLKTGLIVARNSLVQFRGYVKYITERDAMWRGLKLKRLYEGDNNDDDSIITMVSAARVYQTLNLVLTCVCVCCCTSLHSRARRGWKTTFTTTVCGERVTTTSLVPSTNASSLARRLRMVRVNPKEVWCLKSEGFHWHNWTHSSHQHEQWKMWNKNFRNHTTDIIYVTERVRTREIYILYIYPLVLQNTST